MTSEVATAEQPLPSPSGRYKLSVVMTEVNGEPVQYFQIKDAGDVVVFACQERFTARDTTYMLWDEAERVWVYSGDVGTYFWEQSEDMAIWVKHAYASSNVSAPQFLKERRPRWITR